MFMRKFYIFLCCIFPFTAMGGLETNPGSDGNPLDSLEATSEKSYQFNSGSGVEVTGNVSVGSDLYAGYNGTVTEPVAGNGFIYITTDANPFTMSIGGTLTVTGTLRVENSAELSIKGSETNGGTISSATIGNIQVTGGSTLNIQNVGTFSIEEDGITVGESGQEIKADNLSISAETLASLGAVNIYSSGTTTLTATSDSMTMQSLIASGGGTTTLTAKNSINSDGDIQNGYTSDDEAEKGNLSTMNITATSGDLDVGGDLENSGKMTISVGNDVSIDGTMKNDSTTGSLTMTVGGSLTVSGGDATNNPSFVNNGDLTINATGAVTFAHGLNITGMQPTNTFSLTAASLNLGDGNNDNFYVNNLNSFTVKLTDDDIETTKIVNGDDSSGAVVNPNANMSLTATNITADSVENNGENLTLSASNDITVSSSIEGNAGETDIQANGTLDVNGTVTNNSNSTMRLNAQTVDLTSVSNYGNLSIVAPTEDNPNGTIKIEGPVNNYAGSLLIESKALTITGAVTNSGGTTTIKGSDTDGDSIQIGSISNTGGVFNLESWTGGVNITNGLSISGGVMNAGASLASITAGSDITISGDVTFGETESDGNGDLNIVSQNTAGLTLKSTGGDITVEGDINTESDTSGNHSVTFEADQISIGKVGTESGNVTANSGSVTFGGTNNLNTTTTIYGDVLAENGGSVTFNSDTTTLGSLTAQTNGIINATGDIITADDGDINIDGGVRFNSSATGAGLNIKDTTELTLQTTKTGTDITLSDDMNIATGNTLHLDSANAVAIDGAVSNSGTLDIDSDTATNIYGTVTNNGNLTIDATTISMQDLTNSQNAKLTATADDITVGNITNTGDMTVTSSGNITTGTVTNSNDSSVLTLNGVSITSNAFNNNGGTSEIFASSSFTAASLYVGGGTIKLSSPDTIISAATTVAKGDLTQGGTSTDGLYLASDGSFSTGSLNVSGNFNAYANTVNYDVENSATFTGNINVDDGAAAELTAGQSITAADLTNNGQLTLTAENGITLQDITNESGELGLNSGTMINATTFTNNTGALARLSGTGMNLTSTFISDGTVYHNMAGATIAGGDVSITGDDYTINASNVTIGGFNQNQGTLTFNTSDFTANGDIDAVGLNVVGVPKSWLTVLVDGDIKGGTSFLGLEHMTVNGNYIFDDNSRINAAILPYATGVAENSSTRNYWASVSLNDDNTLGKITNPDDAQALIEVDGKFVTDVDIMNALPDVGVPNNSALPNAQMGLTLFDIVDQGTAIWLIHANDGLSDLATKARNLNVNFCNADGTICINYLETLDKYNATDEDLGAYLSARDTDGDGYADSLYVVFDPRFGGPVEVFKIQPVVDRTPDHTKGEYETAGALDDLVEGQLRHKGFFNRTPIEVIPEIFKGTNMAEMSQELYNRMEQYVLDRDGTALSRFSRLFQPREVEQLAGSVILNEHTNYRSFEDHMIDEFIWNRNRNLRKAWGDFEFGMFSQDLTDSKRAKGNRFNFTGGYDWQQTDTLIVGVTARLSHMAADNSDAMDLGYMPNQPIAGHVKLKVADTDLGLGAYMMQILGQKTRLYGNGYLDIHFLDVSRDQNYVAHIDGDGTAFSITSEWGLLHDWLNQYIVGNMYARLGYNFGFSVTEEAAGGDYMDLESDGYFIVTPGYSLTAQKRIYPSVWLQLRPYATIGIEYDVLGSPESVKFKFAPAERYTKYDIDINPLWANIGGGIEVLSAKGIQVGLDYRYQYNEFIQIHNIKLSGSYRF